MKSDKRILRLAAWRRLVSVLRMTRHLVQMYFLIRLMHAIYDEMDTLIGSPDGLFKLRGHLQFLHDLSRKYCRV